MRLNAMTLPSLLLAFILSAPLAAQQAETFGPYEAHYSAINTSQLSPTVARAYGIQRSSNQAMLNIAVLRTGDPEDEPVSATVTAQTVNLTGQRREIELREIRDQGAIYYIGTFRITNEERMTFRISVQPEDRLSPHEFTFQQQFFVF
jgi:hypothetical protein